MSRESRSLPTTTPQGEMASDHYSYGGRDCIHVHGGLLYRGDHMPNEENFKAWADRLETEAGSYVRGLGETELRTVFHLVFRQDAKPQFEVHAEVQALLGAR